MDQHLRSNVLPYLDSSAQEYVRDLLDTLDEEEGITPDLAIFTDIAVVEIRKAIAAGTSKKQVPIPRELLIGCKEAYDIETVLSPEAEALTAALPRIETFYNATRQAIDYAEAIRLSMRMLDLN
ncbi:hypothetical protein [Palleronia sp. LCG004]|uniref:hypothetical protein n=1 Tax=Palleronia sp. LCG004 TaxID=3079304 RepID=UPI002941D6BD|nr:hypothetical protein [Palleronia sp. LCG004]WOI56080.1 hypothetical protein RVY76_13755 [Palleronia sp. LCG004]